MLHIHVICYAIHMHVTHYSHAYNIHMHITFHTCISHITHYDISHVKPIICYTCILYVVTSKGRFSHCLILVFSPLLQEITSLFLSVIIYRCINTRNINTILDVNEVQLYKCLYIQRNIYVDVCTCKRIYIYIWMFAHVKEYIYIYMMQRNTHTKEYICIWMFAHAKEYIYIYIYIYMIYGCLHM